MSGPAGGDSLSRAYLDLGADSSPSGGGSQCFGARQWLQALIVWIGIRFAAAVG